MAGRALIRALLNAALLTGLIASLVGCADAPRDGLRFALSSAPINLDPRFATDAASVRVNRLIYQRLVAFDDSARPVPGVATWVRLSPTHYRFNLDSRAAQFDSGADLTAHDVKATYDSVLEPATASPHRAGLAMIARIEVVDRLTVDFHLNKADPLFPGRLVIGILSADALVNGHSFRDQPRGSGPFRFVERPHEGVLRLQRRIDGMGLEFLEVKNPTVRALKLLRGEVDMLQNDLPTELIAYLEQQPGVTVDRGRGSVFTYLGFNLQDPVTGDRHVRRAVALALDRRAMIKYVLAQVATPASALLPPDHWAGNAQLAAYEYDPDEARRLLRQAGYSDTRRPTVVYKTSSDPFRVRLATIIQQQLADVGIDVELRSYDWGTFYGDVKAGRFQMYSLSWVGIKTPDIFRYAFHSASVPPQGANRGRLVDAEVDALIEAAEGADDLTAQAEYYRRLQARLLEQLPYVPLWYEDHVVIARGNIAGYTLARDGNYDGLIHVQRR